MFSVWRQDDWPSSTICSEEVEPDLSRRGGASGCVHKHTPSRRSRGKSFRKHNCWLEHHIPVCRCATEGRSRLNILCFATRRWTSLPVCVLTLLWKQTKAFTAARSTATIGALIGSLVRTSLHFHVPPAVCGGALQLHLHYDLHDWQQGGATADEKQSRAGDRWQHTHRQKHTQTHAHTQTDTNAHRHTDTHTYTCLLPTVACRAFLPTGILYFWSF